MKFLHYAIISTCLLYVGCTTSPNPVIYQISTIDALLAGVYDGDVPIEKLLDHGDFGIGTFNKLDGEMLILDGIIYQIKSDGKIYIPNPTSNTPFATVCDFEETTSINIPPGSSFDSVSALIDYNSSNQNVFYAIKVTGTFNHIRTRSVPAQKKPYPPLTDVAKNQPEFHMENISGTIVGFRCPPYLQGINVPGYHLHFISDDKTKGGHVLAFETANAQYQINTLDQYYLNLPQDHAEFAGVDLSKDRSEELEKVEK